MKKMIGTERKKDRLYYLDLVSKPMDLVSKPVVCSSSVSLFDHHCRLGHLSIGFRSFDYWA